MPSAETISKWAAGIAGGLLLILQGLNLETTTTVKSEAQRVEHEQGEELRAIRELLKWGEAASQRNEQMIEMMKKYVVPSPTPK
jgi:hypothetical protein